MKAGKTLFALAVTTVFLGAHVGVASAGRLSSSSQTLRATFARLEFTGGFGTASCPVTIEGSFHSRSIAKIAGSLTGHITRSVVGACNAGAVTVLTETLPWHTQYSSFSGTLPNITNIRANIIGVAFSIREPAFGITCLARSEARQPSTLTLNREGGGAITTVTAGGTVGTNCGASGSLSGTSSSITVLNSATRITVTLI